MEETNKEFHLRIAISHAIAGAFFYGMEMDEISDIIRNTVDDYQKRWAEEVKNN